MSKNTVNIDYLTEDDVIKKQQYVCLSFLSPEGISNCKIRGIKVRGVYETYDEATSRAKKLRDSDKYHNVFVGEVGKWLPWDPEPTQEAVKEQNYAEPQLNDLMKSYRENQQAAKTYEKQRKDEMIEKNIENNLKNRKENKLVVEEELLHKKEENKDKKELSKEEIMSEKNLEKTLKTINEEITKLENNLNNNDENIEKTSQELDETRKIFNKIKKQTV